MSKKDDILVLTRKDELNYRAICNFVAGRRVRRTTMRRDQDILSPARKLALLQKQNYLCAHCGEEFVFKNGKSDATADHVIQFSYGGEANEHNIVLVHRHCNRGAPIITTSVSSKIISAPSIIRCLIMCQLFISMNHSTRSLLDRRNFDNDLSLLQH